MSDKKLQLEDFCDVERLHSMITNWARATRLTVTLVEGDDDVKKRIGMTEFCNLVTNSEEGLKRCRNCYRNIKEGKVVCEAGFTNYRIPITIPTGQVIGNFTIGQTLTGETNFEQALKYAKSVGIDLEEAYRVLRLLRFRREEEVYSAYISFREMIQPYIEKEYFIWLAQTDMRLAKKQVLSTITGEAFAAENLRKDREKALSALGMGSWTLMIEKGKRTKLWVDDTMLELLGTTKDMSPEEQYEVWEKNIDGESRADALEFLKEIQIKGKAEMSYAWNHPKKGLQFVRGSGVLDSIVDGVTILKGFHKDITEQLTNEHLAKDAYKNMRALSALFESTWKVDIVKDEITALKGKAIKDEYILQCGNSALQAMYSAALESVDSDSVESLLALKDYDTVCSFMEVEGTVSREYRGKNEKWYRIHMIPYERNFRGDILQILFCIQEITGEKEKELEAKRLFDLANENARLQLETITNAIPGGFKISRNDKDFSFRFVSKQFAGMLGYTIEELMEVSGGGMSGIVNLEDARRELPKAWEMYGVGDTYIMKYRLRCRDGSWKYVLDKGRKVWISETNYENWSVILDIDEQERLNSMLRKERKQYRDALISNTHFFYNCDLTTGMLERSGTIQTGWEFVEENGLTFPVPMDDVFQKALDNMSYLLMDGKRLESFSVQFLIDAYKEGRHRVEVECNQESSGRFYRFDYLLSEDEDDGHIWACIVGRDVTEQRTELERAYEEARRASIAKTEFLSRMSHDIRTPMNGILGMTRIAEDCLDDRERVKQSLERIETAGKQLEMLINDVLDMSRLESGRTELTNENFNIEEMSLGTIESVSTMAQEFHVDLKPICFSVLHRYVVGSPLHIQRVMLNIYSNAIKYSKQKGMVETWVNEIPIDENHSEYKLVIKDNGIGMSKSFMKQMFEPFAREHTDAGTSYQGTGLGMSIMKELVELMNGTIQVESWKGKGTTVTVTIPMQISEVPRQEEIVEVENETDLSGMRVLLVEDNELNMIIASYLMENAGIEVTKAVNGKQALRTFENASVGYYDAIIMDIMMPVMDGIEATKRIRKLKRKDAKSVPIVAMTANAFAEDVKKTKEAGMNAHLSKPLDAKKFFEVLRMTQSAKKELKHDEF